MKEITKVLLENEMDLILAHRQSMRLGELIGLTIAAQTTFATAISEVSRNLIDTNTTAFLTLFVSGSKGEAKYMIAQLHHGIPDSPASSNEGLSYARKLIHNIASTHTDESTVIELKYKLPALTHVNDELISRWSIHLNNDPSVSPYEEIKRKNKLLVEISEQLKRSEHQYKTLADSLPIMIFTLDHDGNIIYANKWMLDYTAQSFEELNESGWSDILYPGDSVNDFVADITDELPVMTELRVKNGSSGEFRWHTGVSIGIENKDSRAKYRNAFLVDIHAQKTVEQTLKDNSELKSIQKDLEEKISLLNLSNNQLEQFAYIASHDLQEPLRKISFYSDYLKTKHSNAFNDPHATKYLESLISATARMRTLVSDILLYSTIGKVDNSFAETDLNLVMEETLMDLELAIRLSGARILYPKLPVIQGNAAQLKQLFENIISNSIKYAQQHIVPEIHIEFKTDNEQLVLTFTDNGIGFDMKFVDKMFVLFQRLHTKNKYEGTGIGLALCKKIVDYHKGTIRAEGQLGKGAVFIVCLPIYQTS